MRFCLSLGICNDNETLMEDCNKCHCSFSKFRICSPVEECVSRKEKPGKCYYIEDFYPAQIKKYCVNVKKQECYSDYGCSGNKKCCQIVDCFFRCVDPVFD
ncbi:hypothetical protein NQ318_014106 [Aromia moschata]|uniref:WAP domain-containing protein n=1 Tax=Aromia moschata TaxID=1265417 RepID=A0AAV8YYB7_9CUCU|nr:hypothetical protein NQ318_014106 [Aromia moschata]